MKIALVTVFCMFGCLPAAMAQGKSPCSALAKLNIPASAIGLPTQGGTVTNVQEFAASGTVSEAYCLVSGQILAVDPKASKIQFQLALPHDWNGKAILFGGGGLDGVLQDLSALLPAGPPGAPSPLFRGYAVYASDSGHQITHEGAGLRLDRDDGSFMRNDEELRNYLAGDALKKTHDAAFTIIHAAYGRAPSRSYVTGGSKGGAETLIAISRWPLDWDGAVAMYPARNFTAVMLNMVATSQALSAPGAYPDLPARALLHRAALQACDGLDGVKDGLISNVRRCNEIFDPATATIDGKPLRCEGGRKGGNCLSEAQIAGLKKISAGIPLEFSFANGQKRLPGFNIDEADVAGNASSPMQALMAQLTIGLTPPSLPPAETNSMAAKFSDIFMRYLSGDENFDYLKFDFSNPGPLARKIVEVSALDRVDSDLSAFAARGGKLILLQGTDDMLVSPRATEEYVRDLGTTMGNDKVQSFLRYYEIPGYGHFFSTNFNAAWDRVSALENWVERGVDPANNLIAVDTGGVPGRTRPICLYPSSPKYKAGGDVNAAASFYCSPK